MKYRVEADSEDFLSTHKDFEELINIYINDKATVAIEINPEMDIVKVLVGASKLNQILAQSMKMDYKEYMQEMINAKELVETQEKHNLSEQEVEEIIKRKYGR